ncbi:hypothetical protein niasHT_030141 [Heterodera trifolii]|uniref:Integrase catalytic domain-containing protein n=1 Tax=Heterodera trifolii TaxID=157864 RepID=A0ABD2KM75_9BILA
MKRFPRLKTIPSGFHTDWQCDLCIFDQLKKHNDGYKYLLVCIDVLSRMIFSAPAKSKKSEDMIEAFDRVFEKSKVIPMKIYSDSGLEFQAGKMKKYFEEKLIIKNVMYSPDLHAGVVERANRTIKERLYRYFTKMDTQRAITEAEKIKVRHPEAPGMKTWFGRLLEGVRKVQGISGKTNEEKQKMGFIKTEMEKCLDRKDVLMCRELADEAKGTFEIVKQYSWTSEARSVTPILSLTSGSGNWPIKLRKP